MLGGTTVRLTTTRVAGTLAALALPLVLGGLSLPAEAATVPSGAFADSYGLSVDTTLLQGNIPVIVDPLAPSTSSCLPATGKKSDTLLAVPASPVADAAVINSSADTDCTTTKAAAFAQTTNVDALQVAAPIQIHADAVTVNASVSCTGKPTASTVITNLTVGGTAVPLPTEQAPNTELLAPIFNPLGLRVILNEQHPTADGRGILVNGIHVIAADFGALPIGGTILRGDIVVSHALASVTCPGGPGQDNAGLPKPDIRFAKSAAPSTAKQGDTVVYTATVTNTSSTPCEVLRFIEHVAPPFTLVSSAGAFGTVLDDPAPARADGGVDAVLRPTGVVIAAGKSATQTFTVKVKDNAAPGTYYDALDIYCGPNGEFASGPLAPVTVPADATGVTPPVTVVDEEPVTLPRTGGAPLVAVFASALLATAFGVRRLRSHS